MADRIFRTMASPRRNKLNRFVPPCGRLFCFCKRFEEVIMKKSRLVMIGNGMAGVRTLEELLKIAPELYEITVFGAEPHPNYNRILLSPVLAGEQTLDEIVLNPLDWYAGHGITLHLGRKVTRIDRRRRIVQAEDGTTADYD